MPDHPPPPPVFPAVKTTDLNGKNHQLPRSFGPGEVCLIVAFEREQQAECDRIAALYAQVATPTPPRLIEVPVIEDPGAFMRWFIVQGMKRGVRDPVQRAQVYTIYVTLAEWKRAMQIVDSAVYVVGTDETGVVKWKRPASEVKTARDLDKLFSGG